MSIDPLDQEADEPRRITRFHGGVFIATDKHALAAQPLREVPLPAELVVPLNQSGGLPALPLVCPGERVLRGQQLAAPDGVVSVAVHAPSSGLVRAIEDRPVPHPSGLAAPCVIIELDGEDRRCEARPLKGDYHTAQPARVRQLVREAGIAGLGGAVFPTSVKLTAEAESQLRTLVINAAECDPQICCDEWLMRRHAAEIIEGARIILHVLQINECQIGIEDDKPAAAEALAEALERCGDDRFEMVRVPAIYPEGSERQLIEMLTGRQVPSDGLPLDIGCVCVNVATARAVKRAVIDGEPLDERIVTVCGDGIAEPANVLARIGTPVAHLVERCGGYRGDVDRLVMGGAMMGFALHGDDVPVVKATNSLLAMSRATARPREPAMPCIRCGECARVCPAQLLPQQLYWHARAGELERARELYLFDCIECGCCDYVCPSHITLTQYFRYTKAEIAHRDFARERADMSRQRFEQRNERLARQAAERERRLAARKRAVRAASEREDPKKVIDDVMARVAGRDGQTGEGEDVPPSRNGG